MHRIELYQKINRLINKMGFDVSRFPSRDQRNLLKYLANHNINHCFDVGANTGQYASLMRSAGFKGTIFSFEPQSKAFAQLKVAASKDPRWQAFNIGLGNSDEKAVINISQNSVSSSILDINEISVKAEPAATYISQEEIDVCRLDSFVKTRNFTEKFFLKIDAQGFESKIFEGAEGCFNDIYAVQVELACISVYNGERLFDEMKLFIESNGFYLSSLESGFADPHTGRLLQVEAIFLRELQ